MRKKLGIALAGGGAWSIAGIGVLKVLEREGIPVDFLAGDSVGALIFAAYSSQFDGKNTLASIEKILIQSRFWEVLSIEKAEPFGLFSAEKIGHKFEKDIGKYDFKDLTIPLSVVTTDFKTGEEVVIRSGPLTPALIASASLPLLFTPYTYQNRLLTDGGASDPIPTRVVRDMGADVVIGVDITSRKHLESRLQNPAAQSLFRKYVGMVPPLEYLSNRYLVSAFTHTIDVIMCNLKEAMLAKYPPDVLLTPRCIPLGSIFAIDMTDEFVKEGEKATEEHLKEIKKFLSS